MHIVITGNPVDGFTYHGPYDDVDQATREFEDTGDWWFVPVEQPAAREVLVEKEHLRCPWCRGVDCFVLVDQSWRMNELGDYADDQVDVHEDDSDFQTHHFECTSCRRWVTLPESIFPAW